MATRVEFAVSCTPIVSVAAEASGDNSAVETISYEIQRSLGGSASVDCDFATVVGFDNGVRTLVAVTTGTSLGTHTNANYIFVRHTGYSDSGLTTPTSTYLNVIVNAVVVAQLPPGGAIHFPDVAGNAANKVLTATAGTGTVQVEVMSTT